MKCRHCPVGCDRLCVGEGAPRICQLVDPSHPDYIPGYADMVASAPSVRDYPPMVYQASTLARSLWDWAVSGFGMADEEEVARRRALCAACPQWVASDRRCSLCGCQTDIKIRLKTEHCPLDRPRW